VVIEESRAVGIEGGADTASQSSSIDWLSQKCFFLDSPPYLELGRGVWEQVLNFDLGLSF
jgi:hypothetical protein